MALLLCDMHRMPLVPLWHLAKGQRCVFESIATCAMGCCAALGHYVHKVADSRSIQEPGSLVLQRSCGGSRWLCTDQKLCEVKIQVKEHVKNSMVSASGTKP